MAEILVYLLQHAGMPVLLIAFGYIADQLSTDLLKTSVIGWIKASPAPAMTRKGIRKFLRLFLDGFIHKIYTNNLFSFRFFRRSCLVSLSFLFAAILIQVIYYPSQTLNEFQIVEYRSRDAVILLTIVLLINFGVDYLSNILTISLLRMAMLSGRILDTILIFLADITLTITLFTLFFPAGLTIAALFDQTRPVNGTLELISAQDWREMAYKEQYKKTSDDVSKL